MASVVILGGGLTGLSCAYHLEKQGFTDLAIYEKEDEIGGLCRSVTKNGFTFDYTGHVLHIKDPYVAQLVAQLSDNNDYTPIDRRSFIYSHNAFTPYPFQTNLHGLPTEVIVDCITGFLKRKSSIRRPRNFYQWVIKHFGHGIGKHFLFPYNRKLWQAAPADMHHAWTGRFVPSTTLEAMLTGALTPSAKAIGYNAQFLYPTQGGISFLPQQFAKQLRSATYLNHEVTHIDQQHKTVLFNNGNSVKYDTLISTLPLNIMLGLLKEKSSHSLKRARSKLRCNALVNFNLGIAKPNISNKHWIYFPERKFSFYRLGFWHNFSPLSAPNGHSSLYGEFTYLPGTKTPKQLDNMARKAIAQTTELFNFSSSDICVEKILHLKHAYVIYDGWRQKHLHNLFATLEEESIFSIGRFGAWKYSSMQDAILDGKATAEQIATKSQRRFMPAQICDTNNTKNNTVFVDHENKKQPEL